MSLYFNGKNISSIYYNGSKIQYVYCNGTFVYTAPLSAPIFSNFTAGHDSTMNFNYFNIDVQNPNNVAVTVYWTDNKTMNSNMNLGKLAANTTKNYDFSDIYTNLDGLLITVTFKALGYADVTGIYSYED